MPPTSPISRAFIEGIIAQHRVVVFSKTWCPFCAKTKDLLRANFIDFHRVEMDKDSFLDFFMYIKMMGEILYYSKLEIADLYTLYNVSLLDT
jgi:hypothetical protein